MEVWNRWGSLSNTDFNFLLRTNFKHITQHMTSRHKLSLSRLVRVALQWEKNPATCLLASVFLQRDHCFYRPQHFFFIVSWSLFTAQLALKLVCLLFDFFLWASCLSNQLQLKLQWFCKDSNMGKMKQKIFFLLIVLFHDSLI